MSRRTSTLASAGLLVLTLVAVALLLPVPYVTMRPGPTVDVLGDYDGKPVLEIEDAKTYPTDGQIRLTTVSVTRADSRVSLPQAFIAYFNPEEAVVPRDLVYPKDQTAEESRQENAAQMASSKLTSEAAALTQAGYDVASVVEIAAVSEDGPSADVLKVDDVLVSVDGQKVTGTDQAVKLVSSARPGAVITLGIRRDASDQTVKVRSEAAPDDPSKARIGVSLGTDVELPFPIANNLGESIGGPSAGLVFALALYDMLTPGDLTDGTTIAGTGTIDAAGAVGPIGGIQQKLAGASSAGAKVFLVPDGNCAEAAASDDFDMRLVRVKKLADAVDALDKLSDDPKATVPTCS
ncbi:PDZ domain-containing protein [Mumia sp. zg.B17]|uniref:YlbL family protein n=1 Tax=unclassified Mumia TaxID=2621872 RepID=UPI001C6E32A2|nr:MULTISPECIES: PDZ domain-containing protein [unclassified Mumia]MBW9206711.1 PDZ domain-containing protein [Mumia sp. zg.B17]MDD9349445.1 PDZ domain-containing protein [Mumia sp.]